MSDKLPFFNFQEAAGPENGPDVGRDVTADLLKDRRRQPGASEQPCQMSVSQLVRGIKDALSQAYPKRVTVVGEISGLKNHTSGHVYFRLKDSSAAIDAIMFKSAAAKLKFSMEDGMEVVARGRVDVYESRGQLQIYVERISPQGAGALDVAFNQMRERLDKEGLFDPAHKLPLPKYPRGIGVITSSTGAAIRDIRRTLSRRWPAADVYLLGVAVQGEGSAEQIARALRLMDASAQKFGIDTIILARGGGSIEDLWSFNEEIVARAIYACQTPIISGVGHEVDVTIADMVADVRAATPTAAAELAAPSAHEVGRRVDQLHMRLRRCVGEDMRTAWGHLESLLRAWVFRDPFQSVRSLGQKVDELSHRLAGGLRCELSSGSRRLAGPANRLSALHPARLYERGCSRLERITQRMHWAQGVASRAGNDTLTRLGNRLESVNPTHNLKLCKAKLSALQRQLVSMSHKSVLQRGFSLTRLADGGIVRSPSQVRPGDVLITEVSDGIIKSVSGLPTGVRRPAVRKPPTEVNPLGGLFEVDE